jgi:hypothetical protein
MKYLMIAIVTFVSLQALAQSDAEKKKTFKKTQEVNFEGSDVDGIVRSPDGAYLSQKKGMKFLPLYNVKKNFDKEIKSSVEYVR